MRKQVTYNNIVAALLNASRLRAASDGTFRAEAVKVLGNIGTRSPAVLPELLRLVGFQIELRRWSPAGARPPALRFVQVTEGMSCGHFR